MGKYANTTDFIVNKIPTGGLPKDTVVLHGFKKPLEVEVQGITTEQQLHIIRLSTVTYPPAVPGGESKEGVDLYTVTAQQIISGVKSIDFGDLELQKAYGASSQVDLIYRMFNDQDREAILTAILRLSQPAPEVNGTPEEDVKTAKNS